MIFHFFVSFLFDSFFVHTSCDCTKYFFFFLQNEGLNQCWFWFSEFLIVVAYWNMNVWGVDFFLISRKNCKIIFHWFHFSRITFFLEKNKLHLHKQLSCKQIFGRSTKNQSLRLVTYKVLQFARRLHTLSHTEQHFHSKNQEGGVASNLLMGAGGSKRKHSHVRIKRQKWGIIV